MLFLLSASTTGKLYYTQESGKRVFACDVKSRLKSALFISQ